MRTEFPAVAHPEAVLALIEACRNWLSLSRWHYSVNGLVVSWARQTSWNDYAPSFARTLLPDLQAAGVLNFEMESSALLTVSTLYGLRAGAILQLSRIALTTHFRSPVSNKQWRLNRAAISGEDGSRKNCRWGQVLASGTGQEVMIRDI